MPSVTQGSPRARRLLRLMLMALLPAFLLLAVALLLLTYHSTAKMVDNSIYHQLQETNERLQTRLDSYLNGLNNVLSTTAEQPELAAIISTGDRQAAKVQLQSTLKNSYGEYLDLLILTRQKQYWANMNSPLYMLEHRLKQLIADTPFYNKWSGIELAPPPAPLTALVQRYPILSPDSGQIIGSLFGGLVLNDNLSLLSFLGKGIEDVNVQLILRGQPVGPGFINSDIPPSIFNQALSSQLTHGQIQGHYFSLQPLLINGEQSELQLLLLTDDAILQQLQKVYGSHTLLALILVLMTALALALYTLRLISSPLASLTRFAEQIRHGQPATFQPDRIEEFNFLGTSLEQMVASLRQKEQSLTNLFNAANSATIILDKEDRIQTLNPAAMQLFGQGSRSVAGTPIGQHFAPEQLAPLLKAINQAKKGYKVNDIEARLTPSQQEPRYQLWTLAPVFTNQVVTAVQAQGQDITRLKQAEKSLRLHGLVLKNMTEAVAIFDHTHQLVYVNHAYTNITGYTLPEVTGQTLSSALHITLDDKTRLLPWQTINATGYWQGEISSLNKNGHSTPLWLSITALRDTDGEISHYVAVFSDISIIKDTQQQLQRMAHYDPLTGLANRSLFSELLAHELHRAERHETSLSMLFIDLDKFKYINDNLGHAAGDALLKATACRIQQHSRKEDILCRFGGDEFILILTSALSRQQAMCAAQRIVDAFSETPFQIQGQSLYANLSIGLACYPEHGRDQEALMQSADTALYQAKKRGRNQVQLFDAEMNIQSKALMQMANELRHALAQGHMELHYQPQFCLRNGSLVGVEALVRWNKPGIGLVSPGEFISLAENTGIIVPLGQWILNEACHQLSAWRQAGFNNIRMAVNLSPRQLRQPDLASGIAEILQQLKLDSDLLELEITESMLMEDMDIAITTMTQLNQLGIHLAIDDFGTGYSSLAYLKNFPVRRLKIDKSFIKDIATDTADTAIVSTIINLAHNMGITVIAEGIEVESQLSQLRQLGCDEGQGYFLAKPMAVADMNKLLQKSQPPIAQGRQR